MKVASTDAAKRAVVDHFEQQLLAETRFEVTPLLILAEQVKDFGNADDRFYEVRRENLRISGNFDRVFWVDAVAPGATDAAGAGNGLAEVTRVRQVFPETWLPGYPVWLDVAPIPRQTRRIRGSRS